MDLRQIEEVINGTEGGVEEKKKNLIPILMRADDNEKNTISDDVDSGTALQLFLDHIPINSIPGINSSPSVLELKTRDCLRDAIQLLYEKNVAGAPITDALDSDTGIPRFSDCYIGFIDFASMVMWSLEECERACINAKDKGQNEIHHNGIFSMLEQVPYLAQTKIGELARSFIWDPFFPVHFDETLFHVLLLLSKHPVRVVPVIQGSNYKVTGFITQSAVMQLLLQSSGLEWFDNIANKSLLEFGFGNEEQVVHVSGDQSIAEAIRILLEKNIDAVAVLQRETKSLIGHIRRSDLYLLLDRNDVFNNRKTFTTEQFIHMDIHAKGTDTTIERDLGALPSGASLSLRNNFLPRMDSPVTNKKTDTLKQAMKSLSDAKGNLSFLVDELHQVRGLVTLRDIIVQFAPPSMDSRFSGGGFFEYALEQTGCHVSNGSIWLQH